MNFIRELVSQNKTRFIDEDFNLDLTYITPRIIAMSFPADGFESIYRNKIKDVSRFLKQRHGENYMVINASNRKYDFSHFDNRVFSIKWNDHWPCCFLIFARAILDICLYLLQNKKNIIAVHCLAGKGRTGSLISSILFVSGMFNGILDANNFYLCKRAVNVTKASQLRYMINFNSFFTKGKESLSYKVKKPKKIILKTANISFFLSKEFKLVFQDLEENEKTISIIKFLGSECFNYEKENTYVYSTNEIDWPSNKCRDIICILKSKTLVNFVKLFRVNFNLFFVDKSITLYHSDLDNQSDELPEDFSITIRFEETEDVELNNSWRNQVSEIDSQFDKVKTMLLEQNDGNRFLYG